MGGSRGIRIWLSAFVALAFVASGLGMSVARAGSQPGVSSPASAAAAASQSTIVDDVLGVLLICHKPGTMPASDDAPYGGTCDHCTMCLTLTSIALIGLLHAGLLAAPLSDLAPGRGTTQWSAGQHGWPPGGVGSRAPPRLVAA